MAAPAVCKFTPHGHRLPHTHTQFGTPLVKTDTLVIATRIVTLSANSSSSSSSSSRSSSIIIVGSK